MINLETLLQGSCTFSTNHKIKKIILVLTLHFLCSITTSMNIPSNIIIMKNMKPYIQNFHNDINNRCYGDEINL